MEKVWVTNTSRKSISYHVMLAGIAKTRMCFTFVNSTLVSSGSILELSLCPKHSLTCSLNPRRKVYTADQVCLTLTPFPTQKSDVFFDPGNERLEDNNAVGHGKKDPYPDNQGHWWGAAVRAPAVWLLLKPTGIRCWTSLRSQLTVISFNIAARKGFTGCL